MVSAAHFSFMGICRNTTFEVLYCNLLSGISRWYHYHKSEVNSMKAEKKEINIQIGKRLQTARENSGYTQEVFAETLDVGVEHYRKIESGVYGLQPEKMLILYEKYRIEPTYLVTGDTNHKVDIELFLPQRYGLPRPHCPAHLDRAGSRPPPAQGADPHRCRRR